MKSFQIVMVQLRETLEWLSEAAQGEEECRRVTGRGEFLEMVRRRLGEVRRDCGRLIEEGGADYDGERVNPATLIHVLLGTPEQSGDKASDFWLFILPFFSIFFHFFHFSHSPSCRDVADRIFFRGLR